MAEETPTTTTSTPTATQTTTAPASDAAASTAASAPPTTAQPTPTETPAPESQSGKPIDKVREAIKGDEVFWNRILQPKTKPEEKKEDKPTEAKPKQEETPPPTQETKPTEEAPTQPKRKPKKPELDPERLVEATARATAEAIRTAQQPAVSAPQPTEIKPEEFAHSLPEEWAEDAETYLEMARVMPEKYRDLPKQLVEYAKAEESYIRKWQRDHPGEEFDPGATEHEDWYEANTPHFDAKDFKKAERGFIERQVEERLEQRFKPEIEQIKAAKKAQEVQPVIQRESLQVVGEILGGINKDYAELVKNPEEMAKLAEKDQLGAEVAARVAEESLPLVEATIALHSGAATYDERNPAHAQVFRLILDAEDRLAKMEREDQVDPQGRTFARREDYLKMSKAEQARHWYIGQPELVEIITGRARAKAANLYKSEQTRLESWAKSHGYTKADVTNSTQPPTKPKEEKPQTPKEETPAPTVSGRAVQAAGATPKSNGGKTGADMFFERLGLK